MKKTKKMKEVEARFKKPVEILLKEYYQSGYTMQSLATLLDVNVGTIWLWMLKFNIQSRKWELPNGEVK